MGKKVEEHGKKPQVMTVIVTVMVHDVPNHTCSAKI